MPPANTEARTTSEELAGRLPGVSLILVAVALAVMPLDSLATWLEYDRAAVDGGQLWRLLTCQLTHWSWDHLFWDAAALLLLGWVLEREDRRSMLVCLSLSAVLIPALVHFGQPGLATYRGLSGIDSAVFVLLAVVLLRKCLADGDRVWTLACVMMLAAFTGKIGFELVSGGTLFVDSEASRMLPVPLVHVLGGALGAACGWGGGRTSLSPQAA
jgi:rhomboid family GlyGly-CTERM serine protease